MAAFLKVGMVQVALADVVDAVVVEVAEEDDNVNPNLNLETCNRFLQKPFQNT